MSRRRPGRRRKRQAHGRVDLVLVLPADGDLELVPWRREMQGTAEGDERLRQREREAPPGSLRLDLCLLPKPLRVEHGSDQQREDEHEEAASGGCRRDPHQKRK
jgi:hypothetical protein